MLPALMIMGVSRRGFKKTATPLFRSRDFKSARAVCAYYLIVPLANMGRASASGDMTE